MDKLLKFYDKYPIAYRAGVVILFPAILALLLIIFILAVAYTIPLFIMGIFYWIKTGGNILDTRVNIFNY